jgi:hypothetical protein
MPAVLSCKLQLVLARQASLDHGQQEEEGAPGCPAQWALEALHAFDGMCRFDGMWSSSASLHQELWADMGLEWHPCGTKLLLLQLQHSAQHLRTLQALLHYNVVPADGQRTPGTAQQQPCEPGSASLVLGSTHFKQVFRQLLAAPEQQGHLELLDSATDVLHCCLVGCPSGQAGFLSGGMAEALLSHLEWFVGRLAQRQQQQAAIEERQVGRKPWHCIARAILLLAVCGVCVVLHYSH